MVIGFLKDNRLGQERKRANAAEAKVASAETKTAVAEAIAQRERERADRYLAELERLRESYEKTTQALIQTLLDINAGRSPGPDA